MLPVLLAAALLPAALAFDLTVTVSFTEFDQSRSDAVLIHDFDEDGDSDLLRVANTNSAPDLWTYRYASDVLTPAYIGTGFFGSVSGGPKHALRIADYDGDGDMDVLFFSRSSGTVMSRRAGVADYSPDTFFVSFIHGIVSPNTFNNAHFFPLQPSSINAPQFVLMSTSGQGVIIFDPTTLEILYTSTEYSGNAAAFCDLGGLYPSLVVTTLDAGILVLTYNPERREYDEMMFETGSSDVCVVVTCQDMGIARDQGANKAEVVLACGPEVYVWAIDPTDGSAEEMITTGMSVEGDIIQDMLVIDFNGNGLFDILVADRSDNVYLHIATAPLTFTTLIVGGRDGTSTLALSGFSPTTGLPDFAVGSDSPSQLGIISDVFFSQNFEEPANYLFVRPVGPTGLFDQVGARVVLTHAGDPTGRMVMVHDNGSRDSSGLYGALFSGLVLTTEYTIEVTFVTATRPTVVHVEEFLSSGSIIIEFPPPVITDVSEDGLPTVGGGVITLTGNNLGDSVEFTIVFLGAVPCTNLRMVTPQREIECESGPGVGLGLLSVTVFGIAAQFEGVSNLLAYDQPIITAAEPLTRYPAVATYGDDDYVGLTITGRNFGPPTLPGSVSSELTVGPLLCQAVVRSPSQEQMICDSFDSEATLGVGTHSITYTLGDAIAAGPQVTVLPPPTVDTTSVPGALPDGPITLVGENFILGTEVQLRFQDPLDDFNVVYTTAVVVSSTRIAGTMPSEEDFGIGQRLAVSVIFPRELTSIPEDNDDAIVGNLLVEVRNAPVVSIIFPDRIPVGVNETVYIIGTGFEPNTEDGLICVLQSGGSPPTVITTPAKILSSEAVSCEVQLLGVGATIDVTVAQADRSDPATSSSQISFFDAPSRLNITGLPDLEYVNKEVLAPSLTVSVIDTGGVLAIDADVELVVDMEPEADISGNQAAAIGGFVTFRELSFVGLYGENYTATVSGPGGLVAEFGPIHVLPCDAVYPHSQPLESDGTTCVCQPGYTKDGAECQECAGSTFKSQPGDFACTTCGQPGMETEEGATSADDCFCGPNQFRPIEVNPLLKDEADERNQYAVCRPCPDGAVCLGFGEITNREGFWRPRQTSFQFFKCDSSACLGGDGCREGYGGPLCGVCQPGFRPLSSACVKCVDSSIDGFILFLSACLLVTLCVVIVRAATSPKTTYSMSVKILINFLQSMSFLADFPLSWPGHVVRFFSVSSVAAVSSNLLAVGCSVRLDYFERLALVMVMPLIIMAGVAIGVGATMVRDRILKRSSSDGLSYRMLFQVGVTVLLFVAHPAIFREVLKAFACENFDGIEVLRADLSVSCTDGTYKSWRGVALAYLLSYCVGLPLALFWLMFRKRDSMSDPRMVYLTSGLKDSRFFWELVILLRKFLIVACGVFLPPGGQVYAALWVAFGSLQLHAYFAPFASRRLSQLESMSLVALFGTLMMGFLFYFFDLSHGERILGTVVVIGGNTAILAAFATVIAYGWRMRGQEKASRFPLNDDEESSGL